MTLCIIQARLGSTRFPRKALADLRGRPVLAHVVDRALQIEGVDKVVVACPPADREALQAVVPVEVIAPRVPEEDVLGRFFCTAVLVGGRVIVRVTGDCPVLNPEVASRVVLEVAEYGFPLADNDITESGFPDGWDTEAFTAALLQQAARHATAPEDREHVTPWMRRQSSRIVVHRRQDEDRPTEKLSIDTPDDLARVAAYLARQEAAR